MASIGWEVLSIKGDQLLACFGATSRGRGGQIAAHHLRETEIKAARLK
jgi:hypothetical protein